MGNREYTQPPEQTLRWVETAVGADARVVRVSRLHGGLTATMDRLTVVAGGRELDVVLRRWAGDQWQEWGPGLVDREAAALRALADHDLPVPRLLAADSSGRQTGVPALLMTALPGHPARSPTDIVDGVRQTATVLSRVHRVPAAGLAATDPHGFDERTIRGWTRDPGLASAVNEAVATAPESAHPQVLVHGDFQPLNMLWRDRALSGVVDWTFAGSGRRETDAGLCRLGLAALLSAEAAEDFLHWYEKEAGVRVDPRADLRGLLAFESSWLPFASEQMPRSAPADHRAMAGQVETVIRAALARLG
ncbi:phosphotransferase family protein [Actinopolymorpha rutila]|uniref:Aminoglycoside phosphotransferase (APT) family kinase protein n=1 Tax=Actinopolymorpha rutila TaxID=446787 RepID=A0A852ZDX2_9ACTN|nr:phosphotransferase [Actinopolymorpha rutila]NYH91337.1 aminoglycoside phosphotransferase (APT) family kinase protein [Actinopolymorpha rutila]